VPATSVCLADPCCNYEWELYWAGICYLPNCAHKHFREVKSESTDYELCWGCIWNARWDVCIAAYHRLFSTGREQ
jgi:hypothetical protein